MNENSKKKKKNITTGMDIRILNALNVFSIPEFYKYDNQRNPRNHSEQIVAFIVAIYSHTIIIIIIHCSFLL